MNAEVVAVVLNPEEAEFVSRAVGALLETEPSEVGTDVAEMIANALPPRWMEAWQGWLK